MSFNTISVIGLGYIGLPTAAMFASKKKKVIGVDVNQHAVDTINRGEIHIVEPDLDMIVHTAVTEGYLKAVLKPEPADAFLIAVPTPFLPVQTEGDIPQPDLKYIEAAANTIASVLKKGDLVILESTSPVGSTEKMSQWLAAARPDLTFPQDNGEYADINIAHCPERVLPGQVVRELVENDRVIGGMTTKCSARAVELYKTFVQGECVITNARTAEMAKLTENSCRDVQIAFANELSIICDKSGIDVREFISLANRHPRINILQPGAGVGGHCIAVDPWFIASQYPEEAKLIIQARNVNNYKAKWCIEKIKSVAFEYEVNNGRKAIIGYMGLTFKANIDDLRESPSIQILEDLKKQLVDYKILICEPNIVEYSEDSLFDFEKVCQDADIIVFLVGHDEFKYFEKKDSQILIDFCGISNQ
jgi:UDP-N-acetyl-D-mannosaminuronic acid dehydrogenase